MSSVLKVVPILVPRMIPIDCGNVRILADISPIVMTMTEELLWRRAVTAVPVSIPFSGVRVNFINHIFNLSPDRLKSPILIMVMPKINKLMQIANNRICSILFTPSLYFMGQDTRT
jgi:hypothetical protein